MKLNILNKLIGITFIVLLSGCSSNKENIIPPKKTKTSINTFDYDPIKNYTKVFDVYSSDGKYIYSNYNEVMTNENNKGKIKQIKFNKFTNKGTFNMELGVSRDNGFTYIDYKIEKNNKKINFPKMLKKEKVITDPKYMEVGKEYVYKHCTSTHKCLIFSSKIIKKLKKFKNFNDIIIREEKITATKNPNKYAINEMVIKSTDYYARGIGSVFSLTTGYELEGKTKKVKYYESRVLTKYSPE